MWFKRKKRKAELKRITILNAVLRNHGYTISTAESCTGGMIASKFVDITGISDIFAGGLVAYTPKAKIELLGVHERVIEHYGIVSPHTAREMAYGATKIFGTNCAIATTGYAEGGTDTIPAGTVCFCATVEGMHYVATQVFDGGRNDVRKQATKFAIEFMIDSIKRNDKHQARKKAQSGKI